MKASSSGIKRKRNSYHSKDDVYASRTMECNRQIANLVKKKPKGYLEKALKIFDGMDATQRDTYTYTSIISAYASKGDAHKAEKLLREMQELSIRPNVVTYSSIINAWARRSSRDAKAAQRAEEILWELERLSEKDSSVKPNVRCYTSVMDAWARNKSKKYSTKGAERAYDILQHLKQLSTNDPSLSPNAFSYSAVINALANSGEDKAVEKAECLLNEIESSYYNSTNLDDSMRPNTFCYSGVINAYAKRKSGPDPRKCEELLQHMLNVSKKYDNPDAIPNAYAYSAVLLAWSKSKLPGSASRIESILKHMEKLASVSNNKDLIPNIICYNILIDTYANNKLDLNAAKKAEAILINVLERGKSSAIKPTVRTFNGVLLAYSKLAMRDGGIYAIEASNKAERLLQYFERESNESQNNFDLQPDIFSYNSVLNTLSNASSRDPLAARRAEEILFHMMNNSSRHCKPNSKSFGAVMNALAQSRENVRYLTFMKNR